ARLNERELRLRPGRLTSVHHAHGNGRPTACCQPSTIDVIFERVTRRGRTWLVALPRPPRGNRSNYLGCPDRCGGAACGDDVRCTTAMGSRDWECTHLPLGGRC